MFVNEHISCNNQSLVYFSANLNDTEKLNKFVQNQLKKSPDSKVIKDIMSFFVTQLWSLQLEPKLARRFIKVSSSFIRGVILNSIHVNWLHVVLYIHFISSR